MMEIGQGSEMMSSMRLSGTQVKRGVPLSVLLVLLVLAQLWGVVFGFTTWSSIVEHGQPDPEMPLVGVLLGVVGLVAFAGVWLWQRWAVYLLVAAVVVGLVSDSVMGLSSVSLLIRLVLFGALAWCIKQKWEGFR
jgi:amino acid transporter